MKSKTKKAFKIIALIIVSIALIGFAGYFYLVNKLKSALTGCTLATEQFMEVVDFEYIDNWIVINVKIEGSDKEYPFLFDTGSPTVVSDSLINELAKHNYKQFSSSNTNDTTNAFQSKLFILNALSIGNVKFEDVGAIHLDNKKWDMLNCVSPYGIIGCNVFESCCFQIDYQNKKITITDQIEKLPGYEKIKWITYRTVNQETPIIQAVLNGDIEIDLFFDTGMSGGISLSSPELLSRFTEEEKDRMAKSTSIPSMYIRGESPTPFKSAIYKASGFAISGLENTENINIVIKDTPEKNFTGIIGNRYLEKYHISLDYKNKRVGFVSNHQAVEIDDNSFGFNYFVRNNALFIGSIFANSELEQKGIHLGDEILSINDVDISELPKSVFCQIYRNEYDLWKQTDTIINIGIKRDSEIKRVQLQKHNLFGKENR